MVDDERADAIATLLDATLADGSANAAAVISALQGLGITGKGRVRIAELVHRARRENARLQRREQELGSLDAGSRELTEARREIDVLKHLAVRTREMLRADLGVVLLVDGAHASVGPHASVGATSGATTGALLGLATPTRSALVGTVAATRATHAVERLSDVVDGGALERALVDEGVVSLVGAPITDGQAVVAVAVAATRDEHRFGPDDIALLAALADHAAIALRTVRFIGELRASEREAHAVSASLASAVADLESAAGAQAALLEVVLAGAGFDALARVLAGVLDRGVAVVDDRGRVVTASGTPLDPVLLERGSASGTVTADAPRGVPGGFVAAMSAGSHRYGALVVGDRGDGFEAIDRQIVERAAQAGALIAQQLTAVTDAEHRVQSDVLADLLAGAPERRPDVARRAQRLGIDIADLDALVLFAVPGELRVSTARALAPLVGDGALVGEHLGYVVLARSSRDGPGAAALRDGVARALDAPVLAVSVPPAPDALPASFSIAMRTARLLGALGVDAAAVASEDYLPYAAVLDTDERTLAAFLHDTIGVVRRHDDERGSDLLRTLRAFVKNGASPTRTARALTFHTNTILQRLERLDRVLGEGWRDDERLFRIGIAVRLDELRERLSETGHP
ncbi:helix-turn-helix domain-containing protein [Galbitalea sp. SE-J8]|uniref:PucR family transcriptional regulator n=1 Tax=Galbitalea sp. SE-J8 TaxID=3054952 RepID=UPI00259CA084|nr:PucR family transcriptional regulator [Galbitalea sp. SE-J8]MDM4763891.1 helix-turn-helix domain-containing protein [Galbitalea sp. SE-J8]